MSVLPLPGAWRARLQSQVDRPPMRPRVPLWWQGQRIGSVEPGFFPYAGIAGNGLVRGSAAGWHVEGDDLSLSLASVANLLRERKLTHVWRDELLAVRNETGEVLGVVERAAVRPLGVPTHAVHLVGLDAQGRHWAQKRAMSKPTDPGLWDTLVGGMVPASDTVEQALERETWEEAGLRVADLHDMRYGGQVVTRRPSGEVPHGYVVEVLDWYCCAVPEGMQPANQDGEVDEFRRMACDEVARRLQAGEFTLDAAAILVAAFAA
ncbi:MAG: Nudix hydrolase-like protein [Ramlibacter sp.]|nr:Nudix hydrolase-like protein [Ramlibacter sp.]